MKWSKYNIYTREDNEHKVLVFNTLTRSFVSLNFLPDQKFSRRTSPEIYATPEVLKQLERLGIVLDETIDERLLFKQFFNTIRYDKTALGLFISFTSGCNFACRYCYESYKDHQVPISFLSEDKWQVLLKYINDRVSKNPLKTLAVTFYGGEPLLNYDMVLRAAKDIKMLSRSSLNITIVLITNGSLLTNERAEELKEYIDWVQITIDGLPEDHNFFRPYKDGRGSFSDVVQNLVGASRLFKDISLRINIDENNYGNIGDLLVQFASKFNDKLPSIGFSWIFPTQEQVKVEVENADFPSRDPRVDEEKVKKIQHLQKKAISLGFSVQTSFVDGPCSMLVPNGISVDEFLNVYKCPGLLYQKPVGEITEQGNLEIRDNFWYQAVTLEPECIYDCIYGPICFGGCLWMAGGLDKTSCKKKIHAKLLVEAMKIHVTTLRKKIKHRQASDLTV